MISHNIEKNFVKLLLMFLNHHLALLQKHHINQLPSQTSYNVSVPDPTAHVGSGI